MPPPFAKARGRIIRETIEGDADPAGIEKDKDEARWLSALYQFLRGQLGRIKIQLEKGIPKKRKARPEGLTAGQWYWGHRKSDPDPMGRLDDAFWDGEYELMLALLLPLLKEAALSGATATAAALESTYGLAIDWTLANAAAVEWAAVHAGELITGINGTTQQAVANSVSSWLDTPESTMGDLFTELEGLYPFGRSRAEMIAVTEVTAAYGEGHRVAYEEAGLPSQAYHEPAHPRCRCWTTTALLPTNEWVIVWQTNNDELVCTQPLDTPWAMVGGCRDLHGVIVSEGDYLGQLLSEVE